MAAGLVLLNATGGDYKPTLTQCLINVGPASPVLATRHSKTLNQNWVNVDPPSVMLSHIQHVAKLNTVTQYWANGGIVHGGPTLAQHWVNVSSLTACTIQSGGEKWMGGRLTAQKTHSMD